VIVAVLLQRRIMGVEDRGLPHGGIGHLSQEFFVTAVIVAIPEYFEDLGGDFHTEFPGRDRVEIFIRLYRRQVTVLDEAARQAEDLARVFLAGFEPRRHEFVIIFERVAAIHDVSGREIQFVIARQAMPGRPVLFEVGIACVGFILTRIRAATPGVTACPGGKNLVDPAASVLYIPFEDAALLPFVIELPIPNGVFFKECRKSFFGRFCEAFLRLRQGILGFRASDDRNEHGEVQPSLGDRLRRGGGCGSGRLDDKFVGGQQHPEESFLIKTFLLLSVKLRRCSQAAFAIYGVNSRIRADNACGHYIRESLGKRLFRRKALLNPED